MPVFSPLEALNRALRDNRPEAYVSPFHQDLGLQPVAFGSGTSQWVWEATQARVLNPFGTVSGGYLTVFADELLGSALGSVLAPGEFATTAELKMSFLKPVRPGLLHGEGNVVRKGTRVAFVEATIRTAAAELVAMVSSTWTVVGPAGGG